MEPMAKMVKNAHWAVNEAYPAGCLAWLQDNDPARIVELRATVEAAKEAYLASDPGALKAALRVYKDQHLQTFGRYLEAVVTIGEDH